MPHDTNAQPVPPNQPKHGASQQPVHPSAGNATGVPAIPYLPASPYVQPMYLPGMAQAAAGGSNAAINSAGMIKAFKKRWTVAILLGLVCGGIAAAATWFAMPPSRYSGEIVFDVANTQPLLSNSFNRTEWINHQRAEMALATSPDLLEKALKRPEVTDPATGQYSLAIVRRHSPNPVEWLSKELKADYQMGPNLLHLALKEDNRDELVKLLNAIGKEYVTTSAQNRTTQIKGSISALETAARGYDDKLKTRRIELKNALQATGHGVNDDNKLARDFARAAATEARTKLSRIQDEIRKASHDVDRFKQIAQSKPHVAIPASVLEKYKDAQTETYLKEIARLTPLVEELKKFRNYARRADYRELYRQLDAANQALTARRDEIRRIFEQEAQSQAIHKAKQDLAVAQQRLAGLKADAEVLQEEATRTAEEALKQGGGNATADTTDISRLKREIEDLEANNSKVRKELAQLDLASKNPPLVKQFGESAYTVPTNDTKIMIAATAAAGVVVFCLFAFGISWMEFRLRRIDTADEVVQQVGLPLVGTIPEFNGRARALSYGRRGDGPAQVQQSVLAESIDTIRTMLLHAARAESLRTVMIASAASREGKTTLACQLATSLARAGRKTLLVDGDLRKPMLHDLYSAGRSPGLAEVLRGETQALDAVGQTFVPDLWLMAAGQADARAIQALSHEQFRRHLQRLREEYDFVVVDSSPVLSAVEPLLLAQQVDAVVFSVLLDVSQVPPVQAAYRRLQSLGVRILGAVVSGTDTSPHSYEFGAYAYGNMAETAGAAGVQP